MKFSYYQFLIKVNNTFLSFNRFKNIQQKNIVAISLKYMDYLKIQTRMIILWFFMMDFVANVAKDMQMHFWVGVNLEACICNPDPDPGPGRQILS